MKNNLNYIVLSVCLFLSSNILAQKKLIEKRTRAKLTTTKQVIKIDATQKELKPYSEARVVQNSMVGPTKRPLPRKTIDIESVEEGDEWGWGWIHKNKTDAQDIEGKDFKTNVHYFKNIRKGTFTSFSNDFDHIVVTDTLYAPTKFLNSDRKPRRQREKRSYIKIIANCIIYEKPIGLTSTKIRTQTDYVFSADSIFVKIKQNRFQKMKVGSSPPFVTVLSGDIKLHKDPFAFEEKTLVNRLFIKIMEQIMSELNGEDDHWKKDKLLIEFQKYRYKVRINNVLWRDSIYEDLYNQLCNNFDSNQGSAIERVRKENDLEVMVEGKVEELHKSPFKYYAIPTKATLLLVKDPITGVQNKLGNLYYKATGDSQMSVTIETKLGYDAIKFAEANQLLKEKGVILENNPPKTVMSISEQPLKADGRTIGSIIPISNQILRFEIDLPEENLGLIKLFLQTKNTFSLYYKEYQGQKEGGQKITLEIPEEILKQLDFTDLLNQFSTIEINALTITDAIMITSNLWPVLEDTGEGTLDYIEISLEFLFEDKIVFYQPERFSSHSVNGSKKALEFVKYSNDYKIIVTGTAFYEFGQRDIVKENIFTNIDKNIILQESMFKDNSLKN